MRYLIFTFLIIFVVSCSDRSNKTAATSEVVCTSKNAEVVVERNNFYNDIALFIAGMPASDSSVIKIQNNSKEWKNYASEMDKAWLKFKNKNLNLISPWVSKNLGDFTNKSKTVFYPFSGPDFVYVYHFLPNADTYYLFALEPVGVIPDISKLNDSIHSFFNALNVAIHDNLQLSFFITRSMKHQMNNSQIQGTLPVILFFMARSGMHIQDIAPVSISEEGKMIVSVSKRTNNVNQLFSQGVEISFIKPGENKLSKLYYFSASIRNDGFEAKPSVEKYLRTLPNNMITFVKSSSYCMHTKQYDKIREIVLNYSNVIFQDDSGVPFKFFDLTKWSYKVFGVYTKPIPAFADCYQSDIEKAMANDTIKLPFRFGYNKVPYIFIAQKR